MYRSDRLKYYIWTGTISSKFCKTWNINIDVWQNILCGTRGCEHTEVVQAHKKNQYFDSRKARNAWWYTAMNGINEEPNRIFC
jgi:hypothetical protein